MELPSGFKEMMRDILGEEAEAFFLAMHQEPSVSVRVNSRKPSDSFSGCHKVKWCEKGYYLNERPIFTLDPLLHAGAYYVQDASSMIYYECIKSILPQLYKSVSNIKDEESAVGFPVTLLDLCAAPGGKTTAMIDALPDGSKITANEYVSKRAVVLRENLTKWGYPHVTITNRDTRWFAENGDGYDIVAVDAPCSGEGMMRKDADALKQWSPELIANCVSLQKEILSNAVKALKPGGYLIYSTCTFNLHENEENANFIADELGLIPYDPGFPDAWGIRKGIGTNLPVYRFMPHITEGEGLFLAIFRKPGEYRRPVLTERCSIKAFDHTLKLSNRENKGCNKGKQDKSKKGKREINSAECADVPDIETILSVESDLSGYPVADLSLEQAISYLRRESIVLDPSIPKGIVIVRYKELPLGAVKNIGTRANNLYPKNWRILMR